jgi:hypothetical protein
MQRGDWVEPRHVVADAAFDGRLPDLFDRGAQRRDANGRTLKLVRETLMLGHLYTGHR